MTSRVKNGSRPWVRLAVAELRRNRRNARTFGRLNPGFRQAVRADVATTLRYRGEDDRISSTWEVAFQAARLSWSSDAFAAQLLYRGRVALHRHGVPVLPTIAHRASMVLSQVCIGTPVIMEPGVYIPHGQVVVDGISRVGSGAILAPGITVGLRAGDLNGPTIGEDVNVGTGSRIIGPISVGDRVHVGANAVVITDIPPDSTAVGVPASGRPRESPRVDPLPSAGSQS